MKKHYKIKDTVTGKYWNGDYYTPKMSDKGDTWKSSTGAHNAVAFLVSRMASQTGNKDLVAPSTWVIEEFEVTYVSKGTASLNQQLHFDRVREELTKKHGYSIGYALDLLKSRGYYDDIKYIIRTKPESYYPTNDEIKAARASLRQLGVKARTYKECQGYFGMMNKDQAMNARLTMELDVFIDLDKVKDEVTASTSHGTEITVK